MSIAVGAIVIECARVNSKETKVTQQCSRGDAMHLAIAFGVFARGFLASFVFVYFL
jgi:hypothetical protein